MPRYRVGGSSSRPDSSQCLVLREMDSPHQCPGDAGGHSGLERLSLSSCWPVSHVNERQHHGCRVFEEARGHNLKVMCDLTREVGLWTEVHL